MNPATRVGEDLKAQARKLAAIRDAGELAQALASCLARMERHLPELLAGEAGGATGGERTEEERLYARALGDFAALQENLAHVRRALSNRPMLLRVLRGFGQQVEETREHLALVGAMDQALQHLVHLMQYDTPDRAKIDVRQGFQLSSGSTNYGRMYFGPPKKGRGD